MNRFTEDEFDIAFQQVYPEHPQDVDSVNCNKIFKILLTKTPESVYATMSGMPGENKDEMYKCLKTIIGNTSIDELKRFIDYVNDSSVTSTDILEIMNRRPHRRGIPIFKVCLQMLQNREQAPPTSSLFASAPASAYPLASAPFASTPASADFPIPKTQKERIQRWWELHNAGRTKEADHYYGANIYLDLPSGVGGSRRRRSSHRKRKSYRKSKRVRHTRRKQTRRHRHRYSRYRR
jgi:hypothetical protein